MLVGHAAISSPGSGTIQQWMAGPDKIGINSHAERDEFHLAPVVEVGNDVTHKQ